MAPALIRQWARRAQTELGKFWWKWTVLKQTPMLLLCVATARPDVLDHNFTKTDRFDRQVIFWICRMAKGREEILKVHAKNKPLAKDVNLRKIAERTPGFSGADLANLINEAAIFAARQDKKEITAFELKESIEKVMMGPQRKSMVMTTQGKRTYSLP